MEYVEEKRSEEDASPPLLHMNEILLYKRELNFDISASAGESLPKTHALPSPRGAILFYTSAQLIDLVGPSI